jgi:threonine dehydrogenase-like Zn-dependent dehydrogenase
MAGVERGETVVVYGGGRVGLIAARSATLKRSPRSSEPSRSRHDTRR